MIVPILADFGGLGVLLFLAVLAGSLVLSFGLALFDRRLVQLLLAATSCLFFGLFCIGIVLATLGIVRADHYPPFSLMIPPIPVIQLIVYALKRRRGSQS